MNEPQAPTPSRADLWAHHEAVRRMLRSTPGIMEPLRTVRRLAPPQAVIAGGAIRDAIWDHIHKRPPHPPRDVDVAYFDSEHLTHAHEQKIEEQLRRHDPGLNWQVRNQARVHLWYGERFGFDVPPLSSLEEAIATWPEYCTCVGARLDDEGHLRIFAPHGLGDLLTVRVRHNPVRATAEHYRSRLAKFDPIRWPKVRTSPPVQHSA